MAGRRERRLWWSVAVVLAVIYATVVPAQKILLFLRARGWLGPAIWLLFGCAALAVAWAVIKARPRPAEIVLLLAMAAVYTAIILHLNVIQERIHFVQYGLVAGLAYEALRERRRTAGPAWRAALGATLITAAAGWVDEGIQAAMPSRVYDLRDVGFNALAGALAAFTMAARRRLRAAAG